MSTVGIQEVLPFLPPGGSLLMQWRMCVQSMTCFFPSLHLKTSLAQLWLMGMLLGTG